MSLELFKPPTYRKLKLRMTAETAEHVNAYVDYLKHEGDAWVKDNATFNNTLEAILVEFLSGGTSEAKAFRKWRSKRKKGEAK